jgi:aspartyl protease family protein
VTARFDLPNRREPWRWLAATLVLAASGASVAQSVTLQGMLGAKALIMVNGGAPKAVGAGETHQGVKVVSTSGEHAVLEIGGVRQTLRVGDAPASFGGSGSNARTRIVMKAGSGGHFVTSGAINGRTVQFMVDTGASVIAMGASDAQRLSLDFRRGPPVQVSTANGVARGWQMRLASVRIGDVEVFDVEAVVSEAPMPYVLLGNSFLNRFQMKRDNEEMVLERRY